MCRAILLASLIEAAVRLQFCPELAECGSSSCELFFPTSVSKFMDPAVLPQRCPPPPILREGQNACAPTYLLRSARRLRRPPSPSRTCLLRRTRRLPLPFSHPPPASSTCRREFATPIAEPGPPTAASPMDFLSNDSRQPRCMELGHHEATRQIEVSWLVLLQSVVRTEE